MPQQKNQLLASLLLCFENKRVSPPPFNSSSHLLTTSIFPFVGVGVGWQGGKEPSPVIRALGRNDELARGAIRFSFGKENSVEDVEYLLEILPKAVENLRKLSPLFQQAKAK